MKKALYTALRLSACVSALIVAALILSSCSGSGGKTETSDASATTAGETVAVPGGADAEKEAAEREAAKLEALRILTPRASDEEPIADGKVHQYIKLSGPNIIRDRLLEITGEITETGIKGDSLGRLYLMRIPAEGEDAADYTPEVMCDDPDCAHIDITCPAIVGDTGFVLPVTDPETGRTVVYTELYLNAASIPVRGRTVNLVKEFGLSAEDPKMHVIFEYDMETGERRAVTADEFMVQAIFTIDELYYNGRIYFSVYGRVINQAEVDDRTRMLYVDVASGEVKYCEDPDGEQSYVYFLGINEGKVYGISGTGELMRMDLDFENREVLARIDNFATSITHENGSGGIYAARSNGYAYIDGFLYVETLDSELNTVVTYKCPLSGEGEPEMVDIDVNKDIYKDKFCVENVEYYYYVMNKDGLRQRSGT